ncbi:protein LSM14 homolog B [Cololabis saira]|uniref:protein LSM14 homolog B n=1 Tax=Cololabis saira TaxID=129043 RepID=UPI002AD54485|nr:protein LSM14 homolog B [Cololabis saira]
MASTKPYIGCKIGLISRAQNRYEGILYTLDKVNSTVVLAKVKCFGTEGRPTDRPTPPKNEIYEFITFRGSDIKDIALCEPPRAYHGLPPDPAIIQSSGAGPSSIYSTYGSMSPLRMSAYNQLAASSLLNQQYAAALGLGPVLQDMPIRRATMVEKAVQTIQMEKLRQRRGVTVSQERGATRTRWQRSRGRGRLIVANVPSRILKFDTDFDFDSSNAQFIKEEVEREVHKRINTKDGSLELDGETKERMHSAAGDGHVGPKRYYDKTKSFFDNISSDNGFRLTWAEERKRNVETFGVPGLFFRGQGFRGGYIGRRGRGQMQGSAQALPWQRTWTGRL